MGDEQLSRLVQMHSDLMLSHKELMETHRTTIMCIKDHLQPAVETAVRTLREHSKEITCLSKSFKEYEPFLKPAKDRAEWRKHSLRTAVVTFSVTAAVAIMGVICTMLWIGFRVYVLGPVSG